MSEKEVDEHRQRARVKSERPVPAYVQGSFNASFKLGGRPTGEDDEGQEREKT